jgi:hypothetical protein
MLLVVFSASTFLLTAIVSNNPLAVGHEIPRWKATKSTETGIGVLSSSFVTSAS